MRVLIVDDDRPSVKMNSYLLREEGYDVLTAPNGLEALHMLEKETVDLVILDVMMPIKDGFTLAQQIRKVDQLTPIIFLTAKSRAKPASLTSSLTGRT